MTFKKLISHRGNTLGPDKSLENDPTYVLNAIKSGYDCEIDLWLVNKELFLGHDEPGYTIDIQFLSEYKENLWIHCKNFEALEFLNKIQKFNYFWHQEDRFTLTSKGFIWTYPGNLVSSNSIIVDNQNKITNYKCYGVCSDFIEIYK